MYIKFLLAAGAMLASVGAAQAQGDRAVGILTPWQEREIDSAFDTEDAVSYRAGQPVQSDLTPAARLNFTSKVGRADQSIMPRWQEREIDSSFDGDGDE